MEISLDRASLIWYIISLYGYIAVVFYIIPPYNRANTEFRCFIAYTLFGLTPCKSKVICYMYLCLFYFCQKILTPDVLYDRIVEVKERVVLADQVRPMYSDRPTSHACKPKTDDSLTGEQVGFFYHIRLCAHYSILVLIF